MEGLTARQIHDTVLITCSKSGDYSGTIVDFEGPFRTKNSGSCNRKDERNRSRHLAHAGVKQHATSRAKDPSCESSCSGTAEGHALRVMSLRMSSESLRERKRSRTVQGQASDGSCNVFSRPKDCVRRPQWRRTRHSSVFTMQVRSNTADTSGGRVAQHQYPAEIGPCLQRDWQYMQSS